MSGKCALAQGRENVKMGSDLSIVSLQIFLILAHLAANLACKNNHMMLYCRIKFACTCEPGDKIHWKKTQTDVFTTFALPQMRSPFFPKCIGHHG